MKTIEQIKEEDKQVITPVFVDAVMMPNGELIRLGQTIGWVKDRPEGIFKEISSTTEKTHDRIWGEIDDQIERSTIKRYNWNKVFGNSLTKEILKLKKQGFDVEDTFTELLNNDRVIRFLDENENEAKNIVKNLKISVYARFGENNTAIKVMSDDDITRGIPE